MTARVGLVGSCFAELLESPKALALEKLCSLRGHGYTSVSTRADWRAGISI